MAVAILREHAQSSRLSVSSQFYYFEGLEIIYEYALKFLVHKNFSHSNELNEFIKMASENGLIEKWRKDNLKKHQKHTSERIFRQLSVQNFYGVLVVCFVCIIVLIFVFILERIVYSKTKTINASRFWKIVEMIIDPDRYFMLENKIPR